MKNAFLLAATLALFSAPALAQGQPGQVDGTLGNGVSRSSAVPDPMTSAPLSSQAPGQPGVVDGTLGNGISRSSAVPDPMTSAPLSSQAPGQPGVVDGTLGNGISRSSGSPATTGTLR
jgi:hypothetical protein